MSQSKFAEMDLKTAINVFTKTLLWKLSEGHPVAPEELEALNSLRTNAGMAPINADVAQQAKPEPKQLAPSKKPSQSTPPPKGKKQWGGGEEDKGQFHPQSLVINGRPVDAMMLPDNAGWTNRFYIKSESTDSLYTIAQNKRTRSWGCNCRGWIGHAERNCKHLRAMGLPGGEQPFEATLKTGSKIAADLMHSDNDLGMKMEPAQAKEVHIPGPEAGAANDELHASGHSENGENGSPMYDGDMKSPERANVNAIREALETQVEMEVGKPIQQKQEEMKIQEEVRDEKMMHPEGAPAGTAEVTAKPGTQIIINVASEKDAAQRVRVSEGSGIDSNKEGVIIPWNDPRAQEERQDYPFVGGRTPESMGWVAILADDGEVFSMPKTRVQAIKRSAEPIGGEPEQQGGITSGHAGGMFGGTDLEGPSFHVGFTVKGKRREASFRTLVQTAKFVKDASSKFGAKDWTMKGAAVDEAQKQLVLEWLKQQSLTTGEVEARLGGGKYSNIAYPILQQLAKEGLVSHKKMRWSLKKASVSQLFDVKVKIAGEGMAKTEKELEKEAGFNFFFPGQVLTEFYPEIQHEIVDYPNARNDAMGLQTPEIVGDGGHELEGVLDDALDTSVVEMIQLPADISDPMSMAAADYSSTSPAGGMGIGRDGKPEVLEGAPLRKENDIRGYMFTDEFYGQYDGIPGAAMQIASATKTAAEGGEKAQFAKFLKLVCGEIAATMVAAFKVTQRPLLDKVPGIGKLKLNEKELSSDPGSGQVNGSILDGGGRMKWLIEKLNDSDVKAAINDAWAQAAVWNDSPEGGFVYEVFVRPETIDTDTLELTYKFVAGTRE